MPATSSGIAQVERASSAARTTSGLLRRAVGGAARGLRRPGPGRGRGEGPAQELRRGHRRDGGAGGGDQRRPEDVGGLPGAGGGAQGDDGGGNELDARR